ncbi:MAG: regulatory iron-sulfur-containing complex subunit RicT [Rubrobacter sp.]
METEVGEYVGCVALTPRRREAYMHPHDIIRFATDEDRWRENGNREFGREVRLEADKLARDHRVRDVQFIGCDVSLDGSYVEVKYQSEKDADLRRVAQGLKRKYGVNVRLTRFNFVERAGHAGGCDTCGLPLCCAVWSGARSMGPVNVRLARQQGVTPNEKIMGSCGEVKCCMRYEHDAYKEFKERAPFKNTDVKVNEREGKVVDYSMVKDSVFVEFGPKRSDTELITLNALALENENIVPADANDPAESDDEPDGTPDAEPDSN